jgi:ABC-type transporter Mla MlaB component
MAKEDGNRLLSKVAKFVRNPLKDWSELDASQGQEAPAEAGYSREALKEMIERRQRNDFVRRREFDMLRKLRQREAAGAREQGGSPSSFNLNTSGKTDGRALTLKKIDEIEEQMSQQWWKGRPQAEGAPVDTGSAPDPLAAQHARAYADTAPGAPPPLQAESEPAASAPVISQLAAETALDEAAIRFAHGDDAGAEAILLQAVAGSGPHADHDDTWRALLDLYRATGDAEKFGAASTRYAQRFKRPAPEWVSLRLLARNVQAGAEGAAEGGVDWYCPAELSRDGLVELTQALSRAGAVWRIDWRALTRIDPAAVAPLATLFSHWGNSPVQLRFAGAERLIGVLAEATPLTDRSTDLAWWQLYLAVLRVMHLGEDFELVALNYCITYEVSPPAWEEPAGQYASLDPPRHSRPGGLRIIDEAPADDLPQARHARLSGELVGDGAGLWQRLDAELAEAQAPAISCAALVRADFAGVGALLTWVMARDARGQRVELVDVHRLLLALFRLAGVADHALLSPRH